MNIKDLTSSQFEEYKEIAILLNVGKYKQFADEIKTFLTKHKLNL